MTPKKAKRSHKSKAEQRRLAKHSTAKVVGKGRSVRRISRPAVHGIKVKSVMLRVDAAFAKYCRKEATEHGSVTEVTRKLHALIASGNLTLPASNGTEPPTHDGKVFGGVKGGDDAAR